MVVIVKIAARIEHEDAAEAKLLHRLEIGGYRLAVGVSVYPPPVALWPGGLRRIDEIHPKFGNARLFFDELLNLTFNLRDQAMRL